MSTPAGDVFAVPMPGGQTRPAPATVDWRVTGPPYALRPGSNQDMAAGEWAAATNCLASLPGLVGLTVHPRAESATARAEARSWHAAHISETVSVVAASYAAMLDSIEARDPLTWLAVAFDTRRGPGKLDRVAALAAEAPSSLRRQPPSG